MTRAEIVDQHADFDAPGDGTAERFDEGSSRAIAIEDVRAQGDGPGRPVDRPEHRGIGLVAADERLELVVRQEGQPGDSGDEVTEGHQMRVFGYERRLERPVADGIRGTGRRTGPVTSQGPGLP